MHEGLQFTSIRTYLSSVRHLQITAGLPDPFTPNAFPRLSYVLRGARRTRAPRPDRRLPITPRILSLLRNSWAGPSPSYESRLLWAACCLGFFGFLRVGEFTARDGSSPLNPDIIGVHDISRAPGDPPNYICVHLRVSKTDPFGRGVHIYLGRTASVICPVVAILSFMTIRPSHLTGPLLRFLDGSTLTRTFLISTVKRALATAGIDPTRYSGHSFRIGAATSAASGWHARPHLQDAGQMGVLHLCLVHPDSGRGVSVCIRQTPSTQTEYHSHDFTRPNSLIDSSHSSM